MARPEGRVPAAAEAQYDVTEKMYEQDGTEGTNGNGQVSRGHSQWVATGVVANSVWTDRQWCLLIHSPNINTKDTINYNSLELVTSKHKKRSEILFQMDVIQYNSVAFILAESSEKSDKLSNQGPQFTSGVIMKMTDSKPLPGRKFIKVKPPFRFITLRNGNWI